MSKNTEHRKKGGTGKFFSREEINEIKRAMTLTELDRKRRQARFDKQGRRRKDGQPYRAYNPHDYNDPASPWRA